MNQPFFERPILNSPYKRPIQHWELDTSDQLTQRIIANRRRAEFITPIPKPRRRKGVEQDALLFDEGLGLSSREQQYDHTAIILRAYTESLFQRISFTCGISYQAEDIVSLA